MNGDRAGTEWSEGRYASQARRPTGGGDRRPRTRPMYTERTWASWWVIVLLWGACGIAAAAVGLAVQEAGIASGATAPTLRDPWTFSLDDPRVAALLTLLAPTLVTLVFFRLDVLVRAAEVTVAFGPVRLVRRRVAAKDIVAVEAITYRPLRDFGGWGIRPMGREKGTAWTIRGNKAVRLDLRSGYEERILYVGSRTPDKLAARIAAVAPNLQ